MDCRLASASFVSIEESGAVSGLEDGRVDAIAIGADREATRVFTADGNDLRGGGEVGGVEDLDEVGERTRHKSSLGSACKNDVTRFVIGLDGHHDFTPIEINDAHAIGDVVHDPGLAVRTCAHCDGIEPDGDGFVEDWSAGRNVKDHQTVIRDVDGEEPSAIRGEVDGMNMGILPVD